MATKKTKVDLKLSAKKVKADLKIPKTQKKNLKKQLPLKRMSEAYEIGNKSAGKEKQKYVGERKRNSRYMD